MTPTHRILFEHRNHEESPCPAQFHRGRTAAGSAPLVSLLLGVIGNMDHLFGPRRFALTRSLRTGVKLRFTLPEFGKGWRGIVHGDDAETTIALIKHEQSEISLAKTRGVRQQPIKHRLQDGRASLKMTLSTSDVAVCCSSDLVSSRVRCCSASNKRTFSMAMTAWSAKVVTNSISRSLKGSTRSAPAR